MGKTPFKAEEYDPKFTYPVEWRKQWDLDAEAFTHRYGAPREIPKAAGYFLALLIWIMLLAVVAMCFRDSGFKFIDLETTHGENR